MPELEIRPLGPTSVLIVGTGSIAVSALPQLVTALRTTWDIDTHVCLTSAASRLVSATALSYLCGRQVVCGGWPDNPEHGPEHVWLAQRVDLIIVWPATLEFMGRCAHGITSDVASATVLSAKCPVVFAPAISAGAVETKVYERTKAALLEDGHVVLETTLGRTVSSSVPEPGACVSIPRLLQACRDVYADQNSVPISTEGVSP